ARYHRFARALREHEGWAAALRGTFGTDTVAFLQEHRLVEAEPMDLGALAEAVAGATTATASLTVEAVDREGAGGRPRWVLARPGGAPPVVTPLAVFRTREIGGLRSARARLREIVGEPPFRVARGAQSREASTYDGLKNVILELCRSGI